MAKPTDLSSELEALRERPRELLETADAPRSKHPALFRAARAAASDSSQTEALAELGQELASRLTDPVLFESIVELSRDLAFMREKVETTLFSRAPDLRWAIERQWSVLKKLPGEPGQALARLASLAGESPSLDVPGAPRLEALREVVSARLSCPTTKRDRPSVLVARGALRLLSSEAPRETATLAARIVEVETRRAGKDEPELALAALEALSGALPLERLRLSKSLERRIERKVVLQRLSSISSEAQALLGATPEEVSELLAESGGLDARGELRIELEGSDPTVVSLDISGRAVARNSPKLTRALDADERREVEGAVSSVTKLRLEQAQRLERALVARRSWKLELFRAAFVSSNALLRDLASRLVWLVVPEKGPNVSCRVPSLAANPFGDIPLEDVFSQNVPDLGAGARVRLAHPVELDPDELGLWRERLLELGAGASLVQPFPQLYRSASPEKDASALARFVGREAYKDDLVDLARKQGLRGLPLRGDGPWELARDYPGAQTILTLTLDPIAAPAAPAKPRRDAVRVLDEEDPRRPRAPREAAPRVKLSKVELVGPGDAAVLSESSALLHALTDELACGTEAFFADWQKRKWKDQAASWKLAREKLALGSAGAVKARSELLHLSGCRAKVQGRFAVFAGELLLDLGTRRAFEGPLHDVVPEWKLDQRIKAAGALPLALPHPRETDEDGARIVETTLALERTIEAPPATTSPTT